MVSKREIANVLTTEIGADAGNAFAELVTRQTKNPEYGNYIKPFAMLTGATIGNMFFDGPPQQEVEAQVKIAITEKLESMGIPKGAATELSENYEHQPLKGGLIRGALNAGSQIVGGKAGEFIGELGGGGIGNWVGYEDPGGKISLSSHMKQVFPMDESAKGEAYEKGATHGGAVIGKAVGSLVGTFKGNDAFNGPSDKQIDTRAEEAASKLYESYQRANHPERSVSVN